MNCQFTQWQKLWMWTRLHTVMDAFVDLKSESAEKLGMKIGGSA